MQIYRLTTSGFFSPLSICSTFSISSLLSVLLSFLSYFFGSMGRYSNGISSLASLLNSSVNLDIRPSNLCSPASKALGSSRSSKSNCRLSILYGKLLLTYVFSVAAEYIIGRSTSCESKSERFSLSTTAYKWEIAFNMSCL